MNTPIFETLDVTIPPDHIDHGELKIRSPESWHLPRSEWRSIRNIATGKTTKVAVLDTGYTKHTALPNAVAFKSFIPGQRADLDRNGHGTHCAGTILARDEDIGVAPEASLYVNKVLSDQGGGPSSGIAAGVNWAIGQGVDVISMSLGGGSAYQPTINAIKLAMSKGIIVCIAAGNAGFNGRYNTIGWPAKSRQGVVVGATTSSGGRASFSSGGRELDIMAPGQRIISCKNDGSGWTVMSGTSMATPFVAGGFSLIVERMRAEGHAKWTAIESVRRFIQLNAKDMLTPGFDDASGWGIFNMAEVLHRIAAKELRFV